MHYLDDKSLGEFRKFSIQTVMFGGRYPLKGMPKGEYQSLDKARAEAVKLIKNNNTGIPMKCFILEYHRSFEGYTVEKISWNYNKITDKMGCYCEVGGKRTYRYKVTSSGTLSTKVRRADLVGL